MNRPPNTYPAAKLRAMEGTPQTTDRSITVIERLLLLRADPRDIIQRIRSMLRLAATQPTAMELLCRNSLDLTRDEWLFLFVTGWAPDLTAADAFYQ